MAGSPAKADRMLAWSPYLTFAGVASLVTNLMLSFEQPHPELLCVSALLVGAAPLALLAHLWLTPGLTAAQKKMWIKGLAGRGGAALFGSYFDPQKRRQATRRLADPESKEQ